MILNKYPKLGYPIAFLTALMYNLPMKYGEVLIFMRVSILHKLNFQMYTFMNIEKTTQNH